MLDYAIDLAKDAYRSIYYLFKPVKVTLPELDKLLESGRLEGLCTSHLEELFGIVGISSEM